MNKPLFNNNILCLDVDDVINNLIEKWIELYNQKYHDSLDPLTIEDWDIAKYVKPECGSNIFSLLKTPGLFSDMVTPPTDSVEVTKELSNWFNIYIVSHCLYPENMVEKFLYLEKYFPHLDRDKFIFCKHKFMIRGDYLIDDNPINLESFGGQKILYNTPHGKYIGGDLERKVTRVNNWSEIFSFFEQEVFKKCCYASEEQKMVYHNELVSRMIGTRNGV